MPVRAALLALASSVFVPTPSPSQQLPEPAAVTVARERLGEHCRWTGRTPAFGSGFLRTANIIPDGRPDYILDPAAIECTGEENPYCAGSGGCDHVVIASVGDIYRQILEVSTRQVRVRPGADRDVLLITLHDASCAPDVPACEQALAWDGERMVPQP